MPISKVCVVNTSYAFIFYYYQNKNTRKILVFAWFYEKSQKIQRKTREKISSNYNMYYYENLSYI